MPSETEDTTAAQPCLSAHSVVLLSLPGRLLLSLQNGKSTLGLLLTLWGVIGA